MTNLRRAAVVMWFYAAGFGLFTIPVAIHLQQRGRLPSFFGLFDMYGGPWSARLVDDAFVLRLIAFLVVMLVVAWAAWLVWNGSKGRRRPQSCVASDRGGLLARVRAADPVGPWSRAPRPPLLGWRSLSRG